MDVGSLMSSCLFVFFFLSVCSEMRTPKLYLESRVFVAFAGEHLDLNCELELPANQSKDILTCSDPLHKQIYSCDISATTHQPTNLKLSLELKNLNSSGEYSCQYKTAKVYWFLRVRGEGYRERVMTDYTEVIIIAVFTGVLLVFSVVGSVCVFRGHGKERNTKSDDTGGKRKQNREEMNKEMEEDNMNAITDPSTSFYASLETRPRSIYDVLDHSAVNREPNQSKAKPKKKTEQTTQDQHEGVFESVYENF